MKTTIASILCFTGMVLYFGVERPVPVAPVAAAEVKREASGKEAGPSEFSKPTTITPEAESASSSPMPTAQGDDTLPVTALSAEGLRGEIETLQAYVTRENAISRLNEDGVSAEERAAWGKVFERLLALRSHQLRLGLEKAQAALESYKAEHEERVAEYTGTKS